MSLEKTRTGDSLSLLEGVLMIIEFLTGHYTKVELWKKNTGQEKEHGQILYWMRKRSYLSMERTPS